MHQDAIGHAGYGVLPLGPAVVPKVPESLLVLASCIEWPRSANHALIGVCASADASRCNVLSAMDEVVSRHLNERGEIVPH